MNPYDGIEKLSPSVACAAKTTYAALEILKEEGGELRSKETVARVPEKIELTDWELSRYEKTGYVRWQSILHFYSIDLSKAGYLRKLKGVWHITEEGENALSMGAVALLKSATKKYREWDKENRERKPVANSVDEEIINDDKIQKANIEQLEESAIEGIKTHVRGMNPYEFQDLVAALLRAMDYFTPFVSPKGKDGGIDIIAFQDPLGANTPRIKI